MSHNWKTLRRNKTSLTSSLAVVFVLDQKGAIRTTLKQSAKIFNFSSSVSTESSTPARHKGSRSGRVCVRARVWGGGRHSPLYFCVCVRQACCGPHHWATCCAHFLGSGTGTSCCSSPMCCFSFSCSGSFHLLGPRFESPPAPSLSRFISWWVHSNWWQKTQFHLA